MSKKAVFIDKDGTLLENVPFNGDTSKIVFTDGSIRGLKELSEAGFELIVVSNQAGVAKGLITTEALNNVGRFLRTKLYEHGVSLAAFYFCPHDQNSSCDCRKPREGMLIRAAQELDIDLHRSWMVGDILDDIEAGRRAGCKSILINNGNETEWLLNESRRPDAICATIGDAAGYIMSKQLIRSSDNGISAFFSKWQAAKNLLCVRLDSIGDVVMTSPAFRALKQSRTGRRITLLTSTSGANAAALIPEIDDVIAYDAPWVKHQSSIYSESAGRFEIVERLKKGRFDAAIIFTVYSQSPLPAAHLCYLSEIPLRLAHCREKVYELLTDRIPETEPEERLRHEVVRQLDLVNFVGASTNDRKIRTSAPAFAEAKVADLMEKHGLKESQFITVHPGATAPSRRYAVKSFAETVERLSALGNFKFTFTGSESERDLCSVLANSSNGNGIDLCGRLTLCEFQALLRRSRLLISNNTSAVHLASGAGTPVVVLYALTNPQHTPWGVPAKVLYHDVPCRYCYSSVCKMGHHDCLTLVYPEQVVQAALELLTASSKETNQSEEAAYADPGN